MRNQSNIEKGVILSLQKYFDVPAVSGQDLPEKSHLEKVRESLGHLIDHYLINDLDKLLSLLYRIDVEENNVKKAIISDNPSAQLSDLIIQREVQKAKSRMHYRQNK